MVWFESSVDRIPLSLQVVHNYRMPLTTQPRKPFLTAEWRNLAMLNFAVDPAVVLPFVPKGTEIDHWNGQTYVSLVGFQFLNTRVLGVGIPYHRDFPEVNLRFYVKRQAEDGWRRGVVFVREIVPRRAIAWTAQALYGERYIALPMSHRIDERGGGVRDVSYSWWLRGRENRIALTVSGPSCDVAEGSEIEFISEHYWGYARRRGGRTTEYRVEHPRWRVQFAHDVSVDCDVAGLYGDAFVESLSAPPVSAFLAEGSPVTVFRGTDLG